MTRDKEAGIRPWITDAIDLDIPEKVSQFRDAIFHENQQTRDFLNRTSQERDTKFLVVAPKGYGKTLLLKAKRIEYNENHSDIVLLPRDTLIDRPPGTPPIFSKNDIKQKATDIQYWKTVWINSICLSVLQNVNKSSLLSIECEFTKTLYNSEVQYTASDVFSKLIHSSNAIYYKTTNACASSMMPYYRDIRRPVALFIDNIDDYFFVQLQPIETDGVVHRNTNRRMWVLAQIGLAEAIRELRDVNPHIKMYATLRKEALDGAYDITPNAQQLFGISVELNYSSDELEHIFTKNVALEPTERLKSSRGKSPIEKFIGEENFSIDHPYTGIKEDFFSFTIRHTMGRPRDLMSIGAAISNIEPAKRNASSLRDAVYAGATSAVRNHFEDMRSFIAVPQFDLFKIINKNVLNKTELHEICQSYNSLDEQETPNGNGHPFCSLFRLGLLGSIDIDDTGQNVQKFPQPDAVILDRTENIIPKSRHYFIHPALDDIISTLRGADYKLNFERTNIIGNGKLWENNQAQSFVCKGDVVGFSKIMQNAEYCNVYPSLFREWAEEAFEGITHLEIKDGDSILAVDNSPRRLAACAQKLAKSMADFEQLPAEIRFGASAGPIEFRTDNHGVSPSGMALRTAARIEPLSGEGKMLVDERFFLGVMRFGANIKDWQQLTANKLLKFEFEEGKFLIRKNEKDPPIKTSLWTLDLLSPAKSK